MKNTRFFPQILLLLLIWLGFSQILIAQTSSQKLTGTVVNESGEAIAGALIIVKGSKSGTATDQNGYFSLTVPSLPTVLEISFIDYDTEELNVTGSGPIKIHLKKTATSNPFLPSNESNFQVVGQVDEIPQPVTGIEEWKNFIARSIIYPSEDRKAKIQGTVIATFEVNSEGKVQNLDLLRSIGGAADQEVPRVIGAGPDWIPGKVKGQPVTTQLRMPVLFKIQSDDPKDQTLQHAEGAIAAEYGSPFVVIGYPSVSPPKVNLPTPKKPGSIR